MEKKHPKYFIDGILNRNISVLSKAITLVESTNLEHQNLAQEILKGILPSTGNSFRLGITGVPGVGKSTFIESFGLELISKQHKVAVLAIDPSSTKNKGSILGDKTRMEKLSAHPNAFIRPTPSSGNLGGVAKNTYQTMLLCEAAGFDFIIIETVGTGQSEISVSNMTDFFLLLMLAGAGDELQGIKRGIIEMADALIITKADGDNLNKAKAMRAEYANAMHLLQTNSNAWIPATGICSAIENTGITEVYEIIERYRKLVIANNSFKEKRSTQLYYLLETNIENTLKNKFYDDAEISLALSKLKTQQEFNPYFEANALIEKWMKKL